jgi:hypothetical protein
MKYLEKTILLLVLFQILSCTKTEKKSYLHLASQFNVNVSIEGEKYFSNTYLLVNPPKKVPKQIELIVNFVNYTKLKEDSILKKHDSYTLYFFKESRDTPRNFIPDQGGFVSDRIGDNQDDYIGTFYVIKNKESEFVFNKKFKRQYDTTYRKLNKSK